MKLLRLKINSSFSSLSDKFDLQFREEYIPTDNNELDWDEFNPFCFVGLNGSGKSNVLEALANIFYHIEGCANVNLPDNFTENFFPEISNPNAYELSYYIKPKSSADYNVQNMVLVFIEKNISEQPKMYYQLYPFTEERIPITIVAEKNSSIPAPGKIYLPDLIIGYSSGENETLSIPFLKSRLLQYDEYIDALLNKKKYDEPESNLLYIDYEMSQAVLLCNFLFQEEDVLKPLEIELGIKKIKSFRMNINLHDEGGYKISEQLGDILNSFKNCATSYYEDEEVIILDFWIDTTTKLAFAKNFDNNIFKLFRAFQILYTLNYRTVRKSTKSDVYLSKGYYTYGKIPSPAPSEKVFYFLDYYIEKIVEDNMTKKLLLKQLSDGEQQFLHTMGICLMLKNKSAILLLDEPETHFNPDWRSKFISILKESLKISESNNIMKDIMITSHSPFIISDCYPNKVILFEKKKLPQKASDLNIETLGNSVNIITSQIFKRKNTIGQNSLNKIATYRKRFNAGEDAEKIKEELNNELGDSLEKLLLIKEMSISKNK